MARFMLRYSGGGVPEQDVAALAADAGVKIVDRTAKMVLLEGQASAAEDLAGKLQGWKLYPEVEYNLPDDRPRIRNQSD